MTRIARPAHPGQFIRMEMIEPLGLSVTAAAKSLGVTRPALSTLLNGHASLSPDMALRVEKTFGPKMDTLLRMQTAYEIAEARGGAGEIKVKRYTPVPATV
jgi:antitoxin HigA-1